MAPRQYLFMEPANVGSSMNKEPCRCFGIFLHEVLETKRVGIALSTFPLRSAKASITRLKSERDSTLFFFADPRFV